VVLGKNVRILSDALVNIFGCLIGDDSFIGPFVEITRGVVIGKRCKIESNSFICDSVVIEDDVFVGHGATFTNDLYPRVDRVVECIPTYVRSGASIGSNSTIVCGVEIGEYSVIGAGSVVTKNVPPFAIVAGNPARILNQFKDRKEMRAYMTSRQQLRQ
jgi:UDP-2-acetamido-3-amino-2,3-dideoxy-glucuronate N-acetyltransferase